MRIAFIVALLLLAGCATAPRETRNACAIFEQRDGWFDNWERATRHAERKYGIPAPILLATIYTESSFRPNARPPRTKLLGFIPWKRQSTAYGFSQALNGTWAEYKRSTGDWSARRTNYSDAVHFVAWYHNKSSRKNGIAPSDAYSLYLAYYLGDGGYARGAWRGNAKLQGAARRSANIAGTYAKQLRNCD
ncbi:transglycosylase SLT domain-containing protein [Pararhizobium gei]|uniref:transglycosylase SLT domain-containing protein n=1 Tax=Pararhizobium gei TaxID=1395951 RepID=UPI0023DC2C96|nr:transglycosylase SLT domain-containing protein [Rhizobium gei]